jgi:hypothetical protein
VRSKAQQANDNQSHSFGIIFPQDQPSAFLMREGCARTESAAAALASVRNNDILGFYFCRPFCSRVEHVVLQLILGNIKFYSINKVFLTAVLTNRL